MATTRYILLFFFLNVGSRLLVFGLLCFVIRTAAELMSLTNSPSETRGKSWVQGFHKKNSKILSGDPDLEFITYTYSDVNNRFKGGTSSEGEVKCPCGGLKGDLNLDQHTKQHMIQFLNSVFEEKIIQQNE